MMNLNAHKCLSLQVPPPHHIRWSYCIPSGIGSKCEPCCQFLLQIYDTVYDMVKPLLPVSDPINFMILSNCCRALHGILWHTNTSQNSTEVIRSPLRKSAEHEKSCFIKPGHISAYCKESENMRYSTRNDVSLSCQKFSLISVNCYRMIENFVIYI